MSRIIRPIPTVTVAGAVTVIGESLPVPEGTLGLAAQANFVYAAGGTTCKVYLQTSLDEGVTWCDIMCFAFTTASARKVSAVRASVALLPAITPTDGTLADNTILDGLLGGRLRAKRIVTGTYTGATTIKVDCVFY